MKNYMKHLSQITTADQLENNLSLSFLKWWALTNNDQISIPLIDALTLYKSNLSPYAAALTWLEPPKET